jgi:DHA3 family macrolide efflux protein-like MFS transporter
MGRAWERCAKGGTDMAHDGQDSAGPEGENWQGRFFTIWGGQSVSLVGSQLLGFALTWWLTQLTGSATVLATATMALILPGVLLGPLAGAYVDRWNRRVVMIVSDIVTALTALWLAYLFWRGSIAVWHVYLVTLVRSVSGCFQWPAMQASTALMVPDRHLTRISGMNQTMQGALSVIGPPLGALLLGLLPFQGIMLMDVGTALVAVVPLCFVRIPQPRGAAHGAESDGRRATRPSIWVDLREGLRYVWAWPGLVGIIAMAMVLNFVMNPAFALMPLLVTDHFRGDALALGAIEAGWGIGLVLGGLVLTVWGGFRRRVYTSLGALVVQGLSLALVGLAPGGAFWLAVVAMFVSGVMNALVNGPFIALLQALVQPERHGRVFTLVSSLCSATGPLSLAVAGPLADAIGVRPWFVVGGLLSSLVGGAAFLVRPIVNIEEEAHAARRASGEAQVAAARGDAPS